MAFTVTFTPKGMTTAAYDQVMRNLEASGAGAPKGRTFHTCFGSADALRVVDVWETMEDFTNFGAILMPILASHGVDVGEPDVQPQHNTVGAS